MSWRFVEVRPNAPFRGAEVWGRPQRAFHRLREIYSACNINLQNVTKIKWLTSLRHILATERQIANCEGAAMCSDSKVKRAQNIGVQGWPAFRPLYKWEQVASSGSLA